MRNLMMDSRTGKLLVMESFTLGNKETSKVWIEICRKLISSKAYKRYNKVNKRTKANQGTNNTNLNPPILLSISESNKDYLQTSKMIPYKTYKTKLTF